MRNPFLLLGGLLFVLLLNACHRPYALIQRTPSPRFQLPQQTQQASLAVSLPLTDEQTAFLDSADVTAIDPTTEPLIASTAPYVTESAGRSVARRINRIESIVHQSAKTSLEQPRPRPKPKNQLRLGNRIRESLGLPLRQELNWWQRIDWKLKASVFVILVAVVFAILNLGQLALVFGLIGAVLLVLGLKRSFKKRRPWF